MIPRSVQQHVTRLMSQLPRRSYSSTASPPPSQPSRQPVSSSSSSSSLSSSSSSSSSSPSRKRRPADSQPEKIDPIIRKRLDEIRVETPEDIQTAWRSLPKSLNPKNELRVRYLPDRHFVKVFDKAILTPAIRPRSIQRLAYYRDRKASRALWLEIIAHQSNGAAVVVGKAKRMCRVAMVRALRARGIHKHGWQLAARDAYFAAQARALWEGKGGQGAGAGAGAGTGTGTDEDRSKPYRIPALRGTVWVNIIQPRNFVALGMDRVQEIAHGIVDLLVKAKANSGYKKNRNRTSPQQQEKVVDSNGKGKKGHTDTLDRELQTEAID
ncbi:hypothetical protein SODALDRAFT_329634, partial [Sodiomyces alkalinus F11]